MDRRSKKAALFFVACDANPDTRVKIPDAMRINSLTAIRVLAGTKNSHPVGFHSRNSTKSTVNPNTTIHKYYHHGGAVRPSFGVGSMDPLDRTRRPSSEGVGRGWSKRII